MKTNEEREDRGRRGVVLIVEKDGRGKDDEGKGR